MPWDFNGHGFKGWIKYGERRSTRPWWIDPTDADIWRLPEEGQLPESETLPEQDEGEL